MNPPSQQPSNAPTPRTFIRTLIRTLPLHVAVTVTVVGGAAAWYGTSVSGHGIWATLGGWSLTVLYVVIALIGGTMAGVLDAAQRMVERLEFSLREWLHMLPNIGSAAEPQGRPIHTIRQEYESALDQFVTQTGRRLRLPRWLERLLRSTLKGVVVDRFIASCTERGLIHVAPQEFRNWLLAEGVSLGFMLIHDQLSWWRYLTLGLMGLLVTIVLALLLFTT
ncbi:MAG: hypothetical protein OJF47_002122 [Nitrospira sp.]|nr:MAG: hypothetical protein OJF47_002122 [Nitrospira sp.]